MKEKSRNDTILNNDNTIADGRDTPLDNSLNGVASGSDKSEELADLLGESHIKVLPQRKLILCLCIMVMGVFLAFIDQTGITVALPHIAVDLNAESDINWAGTSSLLANCVCQIVVGRFSDIFGRKGTILWCFFILGVSDLACGFAKTGPQFFIFRAFCGIANGGIQTLTNIVIADMVPLKQRGKYNGILSSGVGLANICGPFILAAFTKYSSWRMFFHIMPAVCAVVAGLIYFTISNDKGKSHLLSKREKVLLIDYSGFILSTAGIILLLIPISGGGVTYKWDSSIVIVMFIVGGLCLCAFILVEWKIPSLPMLPLRLFKTPSLCFIFLNSFFYGMAQFSFLYYLPYYYQIVRGDSALKSSALLTPLVGLQSVSSIVGGQMLSRFGRFKFVLLIGFGLWFIATCLLLTWDTTIETGKIVVILMVMGFGYGFTFQPTSIAAQAQARRSDRAVVIGTRNVLRSFGGAVGIAMGTLIVSNTLLKEIQKAIKNPKGHANIPHSYLLYLKQHIYSTIEITGLNDEQTQVVREMYMKSIRTYFYTLIPMLAICLFSTMLLKDNGIQCIDEDPDPDAYNFQKVKEMLKFNSFRLFHVSNE